MSIIILLKDRRFLKSIIAGAVVAIVDLILLFLFKGVFNLPYWFSINFAFFIAIILNFLLQKFWTFKDQDLALASRQFVKFLLLTISNLVLNNILTMFIKNIIGFNYIFVQALIILLLAGINFTIYRLYVFKGV